MKKLTLIVITVLMLALGGGIALHAVGRAGQTVEVVQWANGHVYDVMKKMADEEFNKAGYKTKSGRRIEVKVFNQGSAEQSDDLISRVKRGVPKSEFPDPTIVTPSSADWLVRANYAAGTIVVNIARSRAIAKSYIGIVTYRDMAEALGWPDKEIGYADIIALRKNPEGWASVPKGKAGWGQKPLLAFTDPVTSTTGRSVLFGLYGMGVGKTPEQLTLADVTDPKAVAYARDFQTLIDHYMIGTQVLNTKVYQGPEYGHFFIMPEDNLIALYDGGQNVFVNGVPKKVPPIKESSMVMIYPKEGAMVRDNIAGIVNASWVTAEEVEGANKWIDYLLRDKQQRAFMGYGFRPATDIPLDPASKITGKYGLNPNPKVPLLTPETTDPAVANAIEKSWVDIKKPGIVTFVADTSGSMDGEKLNQAKDGLKRALDSMAENNEVGLVTFSDSIHDTVSVAPLTQNKFRLTNTINKMSAKGGTALYDAIKAGVEMTDSAAGGDNAIRAVVVLTDGQANQGQTHLDNLVKMTARSEVGIREFSGLQDTGTDVQGRAVPKKDIIGSEPALPTKHQIQIFFIGIGTGTDAADMDVGRILAQATGAEFQAVAEKDLANILELFSKYF